MIYVATFTPEGLAELPYGSSIFLGYWEPHYILVIVIFDQFNFFHSLDSTQVEGSPAILDATVLWLTKAIAEANLAT